MDNWKSRKEGIWWHLNSGDLEGTWSLPCLSSAGDGSSWVNIISTCKTCLELATICNSSQTTKRNETNIRGQWRSLTKNQTTNCPRHVALKHIYSPRCTVITPSHSKPTYEILRIDLTYELIYIYIILYLSCIRLFPVTSSKASCLLIQRAGCQWPAGAVLMNSERKSIIAMVKYSEYSKCPPQVC